MRPRRLSPADLAVLWPEDHGWPQDVGLLAYLDGADLLDEAGHLRTDVVVRHVRDRVSLLPERFSSLLLRPRFGFGLPYWVDADELDLGRHLRIEELPPGAGEAQVIAACERLRRQRFAPDAPLWRLTLLTGLEGRRLALFINAHHCVVDGASGIAALAAFVDQVPLGQAAAHRSRVRRPTALELLLDAGARHLAAAGRTARGLVNLQDARRRLAGNLETFRHLRGYGSVPVTSVYAALGPGRRWALVAGALAGYRGVARAFGTTINDVLLCVVAGGYRELLAHRGELQPGMVFRVAVPVSLHDRADVAEGNDDGGLLLPLPVGEPDVRVRLAQIAQASAQRKRDGIMSGATAGMFRMPWVQRLMIRLAAHQHVSNGYVANVRGPAIPLSFAGAPITAAFPVVPLLGNTTIGAGALSYDGQFNITVIADRNACPDIDVFVAGMRQTLRDLVALVPRDAARSGA